MVTKKFKNLLFIFGTGLSAIGLILFILIPYICGSGFHYEGPAALLSSLVTYSTLAFNETLYVLFFVLTAVAIICLIWWACVLGKNNKKSSVAQFIVSAILVLSIFVVFNAYFVAPVVFNEVEGTLFSAILKLRDSKPLGSGLSMCVIALEYVGLAAFTVYGMMDMVDAYKKDEE